MLVKILIVAGIMLTGGIFTYNAVSMRMKARKARLWPTTKANITSCEVKEDILRSSTGSILNVYYVEISYDYTVNGVPLTGHRITLGSPHYDYQSASSIHDRFAVGSEVDVYYDPKNPANSVLVPYAKHAMRSLVPGIFFLAIGVAIIIIMAIFG